MLRQAAGAPAATGGPHVEERAAFAARPTTAASGAGTAPPMAAPARDSLQRISGISEELERLLNGHGVTRYVHIAGWSRDDIQRFDRLLGSDGRITRENWIEQAQLLATGGATAYAKSFDDRLRGGDRQQTPSSRIDLAALPSIKSEAYRPRVDATAASAAVTAATNSGYRPPRSTDVDDLKRIRGVGVLIEKKLNSIGVVSYEQVAQWTKEDIDRISHMLDFVGRIERENWVEQARILAAGGATEFSRRVDLGEVETSKKG
jgi:predicted flap endonuclease-1-like 5' DNA nuclease